MSRNNSNDFIDGLAIATNGLAPHDDLNDTASPIDISSLAAPTNFADLLAPSTVIITSVQMRKPERNWWIRTHPDPSYRIALTMIQDPEDKEFYAIYTGLVGNAEIISHIKHVRLITSVTIQGNVFLWPIVIPDAAGRTDRYSRSAADIAKQAQTRWCSCRNNRELKEYSPVFIQVENPPEPVFPQLPFNEILNLALRDRVIRSLDHPLLQGLRGEVL